MSEVNTYSKEGLILTKAVEEIVNLKNTYQAAPENENSVLNSLYDSIPWDKVMLPPIEEPKTFVQKIQSAINQHTMENDSNTPDFILAEYLQDCLNAFNKCSREREKWFGKGLEIEI